MEDKIFILGKRCIRAGLLLLGVLTAGFFVPSVFVKPLVADEPPEGLVSSNVATLALALRQNVVNYLPTDGATLLIKSDNQAGYLLTVEERSSADLSAATSDESNVAKSPSDGFAYESLIDLAGRLGDLQRSNFSLTELQVKLQNLTNEHNPDQTTLVISATPVFYRPSTTMFEIEYMQEMTPEICDASPTPVAYLEDGSLNLDVPETTLIDSRDGTVYTVRKLADGRCWMSENLQLTLGDRVLTGDDTDIPETVILSERKEVVEERTITFEDDPEEEDPEVIYLDPFTITGENADQEVKDIVQMSVEERAARAKARAEQELWAEDPTEEGANIKKLTASEAMVRAGAADILSEKDARDVVTELLGASKVELSTRAVTDYAFRATYPTQSVAGTRWGSSQPTEDETNVARSQKSDDPAYGTYYNWYAATVGTGTYYMSTKSASATICPKGWTLPSSAGSGSFSNLVEIYKLDQSTADVDSLTYMTSDPVSFVISGIYYYNGLIGGQGEWGGYWTKDVSNLVAATFSIDNESAEQNFNHKTMGFPVRCVVKE